MKRFHMFCGLLCLVLLLAAPGALAEPQLSFLKEERHGSSVIMPLMVGMENAFVQDTINKDIEERGGYTGYLATLRALMDDQQSGIQVQAEGSILPLEGAAGLLRLRVDASGRIGPGRPGYRVTPLMYDLTDGRAIAADELFTDIDAAAEAITEMVSEHILPELSNYLDPSGFEPVPMEQLLIEENGLSLFYSAEQLTLLSGRPASLHFFWHELQDLLKLEEGSLLMRLGVPAQLAAGEGSREWIEAAASQGRLPGIPFKLGDSLGEIRGSYPLQIDPEAFPGGSKYELEDARMRGNLLIAEGGGDELSGILCRRMLLHGLATGSSTREQVTALLGPPSSSLDLDEAAAYSYGLEAGRLDGYAFGSHELRFNYDEQELLRAVWLRQAQQQGN